MPFTGNENVLGRGAQYRIQQAPHSGNGCEEVQPFLRWTDYRLWRSGRDYPVFYDGNHRVGKHCINAGADRRVLPGKSDLWQDGN